MERKQGRRKNKKKGGEEEFDGQEANVQRKGRGAGL